MVLKLLRKLMLSLDSFGIIIRNCDIIFYSKPLKHYLLLLRAYYVSLKREYIGQSLNNT